MFQVLGTRRTSATQQQQTATTHKTSHTRQQGTTYSGYVGISRRSFTPRWLDKFRSIHGTIPPTADGAAGRDRHPRPARSARADADRADHR
eukprot:scaffold56331_cov60-Phaeocystis_antarctica.AAC.2